MLKNKPFNLTAGRMKTLANLIPSANNQFAIMLLAKPRRISTPAQPYHWHDAPSHVRSEDFPRTLKSSVLQMSTTQPDKPTSPPEPFQ